ncbi:MAG: glycosyltransferase family 2 protein [Lachnospiraceae bacterium]
MAQPLISIIVPVYKVPEQYLKKCIESIMEQTLKEIEILLIDDGSPDQCGALCDSYAEQDNRIKVIHKKNGGLSSARNAGFQAAAGDWIMFVDGDDWIEPDMCKAMYHLGIEKDVQLVMCGITKDYGHSSTEYKFYLDEKVYTKEECRWLQQQLLIYNGNIAVAYSKLIRRGFLAAHHILHDEQLRQGAEGLEFNLRLFEQLERACFLNRPFYHYIYNENSISASHNEENHEMVIRCFEQIRDFIETSRNKEMLLPWFDNRLLYVIITTAISGYFNPANPEPYAEKKKKYQNYLHKPIIQQALRTKNRKGLSFQRQIVLILIQLNAFRVLDLLGKIRKWQKGIK